MSHRATGAGGYTTVKRYRYKGFGGFALIGGGVPDVEPPPPPPPGDNPLVNSSINVRQLSRITARMGGVIESACDAKTKQLIPLDINRIIDYTGKFMANPSLQRMRLSTVSPVPINSQDDFDAFDWINGAALYSLAKKDVAGASPSPSTVATAVINELVAQTQEFTTDFAVGYYPGDSRTRRWVYSRQTDQTPWFFTSDSMKKAIHAFENAKWVLTGSTEDVNKRKAIVTWILNYGVYARQRSLDVYLNEFWSRVIGGVRDYGRRYVRDYSATPTDTTTQYMYSYIDSGNVWRMSQPTFQTQRIYNNRRGCHATSVIEVHYCLKGELDYIDFSSVGNFVTESHIGRTPGSETYYTPSEAQVLAEIDRMKLSGQLYQEEMLKFATFPNGDMSDFHRTLLNISAGSDGPGNYLGFQYACLMACQYAEAAYLMAINGDRSLVDFSTSEGKATPPGWSPGAGQVTTGTVGGPKSLMTIVNRIKHITTEASPKLWATRKESTVRTLPELRQYVINSRYNTTANVYGFHRFLHQANMFLKNADLKALVSQSIPGMPSYTNYGQPQGNIFGGMFGGPYNNHPASALMYACMEDLPDTTI